MDIRQFENKLFDAWSKKYPSSTFTRDGCPNPKTYLSEKKKFVFALKDSNLGDGFDKLTYDLRHELGTEPHLWWLKIARWCYFLMDTDATWQEAREKLVSRDSIKGVLSHYCFIQLKKESGAGSISNSKLYDVVQQDKNEIIEQLCLYHPDFVIACGNGDQLSSIFNCSSINRKETISGVGYWKIDIGDKSSYLIDYCHPSIRSGTKVSGLIAQGLSKAISEIEKNSNEVA